MSQTRFLFLGTGNVPSKFFESALCRLQPVYKFHVDVVQAGSAYEALESKYSYDGLFLYNSKDGAGVLRDQLQESKQLKWVHCFTAGVDAYLRDPVVKASQIPMTNVKSAYSEHLAQFVVFAVLFFAKKAIHFRNSQFAKLWAPTFVDDVAEQTMLIVGYGDIGTSCAKKLKDLGMKVVGVKARPESTSEKSKACLHDLQAVSQLESLLPTADYVLNLLPVTPATQDFFDARRFRLMKPTGIYMNFGRGQTNNEEDLLASLKEGQIAGAVMDVFKQEPLPSESEFYSLENVLFTPHSADDTPNTHDQAVHVFEKVLQTYLSGAPLLNVVDKERGY
ncbi:ddh [Symbiodinium natans]|uniref:Ddh protein n=1 Tax=Symbiodinium natans TaxID=878477 RepID=A0A812UWL4_9DINO|nr:ddh [Symbiodinium natans]